MFPHGFFRICAASPPLEIANPARNLQHIYDQLDRTDADLVLLPELCLTGYTCGDLFLTDSLIDAAKDALLGLADLTKQVDSVVVAGLPLLVNHSLMNVAAVVSRGTIHGLVPKSYLPTYHEFYESRHFRRAGKSDPKSIQLGELEIPFGTDLIFEMGPAHIGIEICEDLWGPIPPSSYAALAGANVLLNLSASNETIGKADWRRDLVRVQSGRCLAVYAYASSGPGESTSDLVFGGHAMISENGRLLGESRRIGDGQVPEYVQSTEVTCDVDLQQIARDRRVVGTFSDACDRHAVDFRRVVLPHEPSRDVESGVTSDSSHLRELCRWIDPQPFVPSNESELDARCSEILAIQVAGLVKRLTRLPENTVLSIGVSGGLDSTLALIVTVQACDAIGWSRDRILAMVMPGFGTTSHTKTNAEVLLETLGVKMECVDIRSQCVETFRSMGHQPFGLTLEEDLEIDQFQVELTRLPDDAKDLVFENVQARMRTMLLMTRGFVIGTGDMSEQALGWSTYNADHMSMYNVNTSVPKSLVRFLVRHYASRYPETPLCGVLNRIADTPISPELLPPTKTGEIRQSTEASVGPYELHDFFLYHLIRHGFTREKILYLALHAPFEGKYSGEKIRETLDLFYRRFFTNQFKRNCVPDGPKVGSVSLSPRGDWRMPSDADSDAF